jgi:hypothetical protein
MNQLPKFLRPIRPFLSIVALELCQVHFLTRCVLKETHLEFAIGLNANLRPPQCMVHFPQVTIHSVEAGLMAIPNQNRKMSTRCWTDTWIAQVRQCFILKSAFNADKKWLKC